MSGCVLPEQGEPTHPGLASDHEIIMREMVRRDRLEYDVESDSESEDESDDESEAPGDDSDGE